jgi:hypothetical protein
MLVRSVAVAALGLLLVAGCGPAKLNESKVLTLDDNNSARAVILPAQSKPQKITVDYSSSDGDVSVYVFKEEDLPKEDPLITAPPAKALGKHQGKQGNFTVEVPANTPTQVVVRSATAKKTDVTVKVTNAP